MSRASLVAAATTGVAAGVVGGLTSPVVGGLAGAVVGIAAGLAVRWREQSQVERLTTQLAGWLRGARPRSVVLTGASEWVRLGAVLNDVAAAQDRLEDELERHRPWRHELVDSLVSAAVLFDEDGHLAASNRAARELLGRSVEGTGRTALQALGSAVLADAVAAARGEDGHVEVDTAVGAHQVSAAVAAVGAETLVMLDDRTRERRVEELRRNFVVNASHELKTPATSIQTLSEALEVTASRDPARVPDLVVRLREEAERLVRLVHDLLDLRRLEEPGEVERVPVDLPVVARDVLADLDDRARARGIDLSLDSPDEATIDADPDDVRLVLRNLVANAIQYNRDNGRVDVRIVRREQAWAIEVADTGIGIPQQDLRRIFERFYRVDVARSRQTGGTGLGLSIVRHAVERHGGSISVDSLLGTGSTFRVLLPDRDEAPTA